MYLMVLLLVALSSCLLIAGQTQQFARLDKALATQSNRDAVTTMVAAAAADVKVVRFDVHDEMLVLSGGTSFAANWIYTYSVFADQVALDAWIPAGTFSGDKLMFPSGLDTDLTDDGLVAYPRFSWANVQAADIANTKDSFSKITQPTRDEAGVLRYDNACTLDLHLEPFCFENIWYKTLSAQQRHNAAGHMGVFAGDMANTVIEWGMATLQDRNELKPRQQQVRVSSAPKSADNMAAVQEMSRLAHKPSSGVLRFEMYDEMLVLADGSFFPSMKLLTYAVFNGETDVTAWDITLSSLEATFPGISTFKTSNMQLPDGVMTDTQNPDIPATNPIFFWTNTIDFVTQKAAFDKILTPTRLEDGVVRYDNACFGGSDSFCFEFVEYTKLPESQDTHMASAHMGEFFGDMANVVIGWGMSILTQYIARTPAADPEMLYMGVEDISEINQAICKPQNNFADSDIGTKMPDSCCVPENWKTGGNFPPTWFGGDKADELFKPGATKYSTCYVRVAPWPFAGDAATGEKYNGDWIRNYIGCENGKLIASEECVPFDQTMVTPESKAAKTYDYPMTEQVGLTKYEDLTALECGCSRKANSPNFDQGEGCYIASANLAKMGGSNPAVFLKVSGTCPATVGV